MHEKKKKERREVQKKGDQLLKRPSFRGGGKKRGEKRFRGKKEKRGKKSWEGKKVGAVILLYCAGRGKEGERKEREHTPPISSVPKGKGGKLSPSPSRKERRKRKGGKKVLKRGRE